MKLTMQSIVWFGLSVATTLLSAKILAGVVVPIKTGDDPIQGPASPARS
nr:hypothetical protein [Methanoculleus marisnigri]